MPQEKFELLAGDIARLKLSIALLLVGLLVAAPVKAHSPYFTESVELGEFEGQPLYLKILAGDGIVAADPLRAVVMRGDGALLAVSPLSTSMYVKSSRLEGADPVVYDAINRRILNFDRKNWQLGAKITNEDGQPKLYPELMTDSFGFSTEVVGFGRALGFELGRVWQMPTSGFLGMLWWSICWSLLGAAIAAVWRRRKADIKTIVTALIGAGLLLALATSLALIGLVPLLSGDIGEFRQLVLFSGGALLAGLLRKAAGRFSRRRERRLI